MPWWVTTMRMPASDVRERAGERVVEAREHRVGRFAAGRRGELAPSPRRALARPAGLDLVAGLALPLAAVAFAEPGVGEHRALRGGRR